MRRSISLSFTTLVLGLAFGCGQMESSMKVQEADIKKHYENQKQSSAKLTPRQKRLSQERLRMQFGDIAEAGGSNATK